MERVTILSYICLFKPVVQGLCHHLNLTSSVEVGVAVEVGVEVDDGAQTVPSIEVVAAPGVVVGVVTARPFRQKDDGVTKSIVVVRGTRYHNLATQAVIYS